MFFVDLWKWFHYTYIYAPKRMKYIQFFRKERSRRRRNDRLNKELWEAQRHRVVGRKIVKPSDRFKIKTAHEILSESSRRMRERRLSIHDDIWSVD